MQSKERYTPETINVTPIDMKKLNNSINEFFHKDGKQDITYSASGILALMQKPKSCIIDDEFVGHDISDNVTFYVYESGTRSSGIQWHSCLPSHEITLSLNELNEYLKPQISLAEFTKERRGYKSRIRANEADWIRYLNK